jgi:hypothetical protein
MADMTAPIVLLSEQQQQWLDSATENHWLRRIDFQEISHLQMGVASGGFGIVHAGKWRGMPVAIKVLFSLADFIQEVTTSLLSLTLLASFFQKHLFFSFCTLACSNKKKEKKKKGAHC